MDDFGDTRIESIRSGAQGRENSLRGKSEEKGDDRNNYNTLPLGGESGFSSGVGAIGGDIADESENKEDKKGDGVGINCAAR